MKVESLAKLYKEQLQDLYDAENRIIDALPKMAGAAKHPELREAFNQHLEQTKEHKERLERVFDMLGEKAERHDCEAMKGIIREGDEILKAKGDSDALDAALITAAQRVEHYEMAGYGSVRNYARRLGHEEQSSILQKTLDEEGETDHRLTQIAEKVVNIDAMKE